MEKARERSFDRNIELLHRYRDGDSSAGEELATQNSPLVYSIASRFTGRGVEKEELVEIGMIGLVKAINTFDFSRECAFSTYAVPLIFGEIRRFLRDDGMIKVSRENKRLAALLAKERERRERESLDTGIASLAHAVGISREDAAAALFSTSPVRSLDESAYDDDDSVTLGATVYDEDEGRQSFDKLALRFAIDKLCEVERRVIALRYYRDMSQAETARVLGLTQVKVSRVEKKILAKLKEDLV